MHSHGALTLARFGVTVPKQPQHEGTTHLLKPPLGYKLAITLNYIKVVPFGYTKLKQKCQAHTIDVMLASIGYPVFNPKMKTI